jgi:hypothetical protein
MNFGLVVLMIVSGWSLLSIVVALAVGGMAASRDSGAARVRRLITTADTETRPAGGALRRDIAS